MTMLQMIQVNIEIILAILCITIFVLTMVSEKDDKKHFKYIWFIDIMTTGLLISDVLAICYRGNTSTLGFYMVRIANFVNYVFLYLTILYLVFFVEYMFGHPEKGKLRIAIAKCATGFAIILNFINVFTPITYSFDEFNKYYRLNGWYVTAVCLLISVVLLASVIIIHRKETENAIFIMVLFDVLMPFIASVVQVFIYGIAITNIAIGLTQIILFMILYRAQIRKIKERDLQLEEYNAKLILTQVQPHFMLNALSTIQYLCKTDSEAAFETISDFSVYLRNNMEFSTSTNPISFEKELSHIEKYVSIEQKRFGDRINVVYDIKEKKFDLPALSVQPLVENAIKHGISKKRKGGTVEISTWKGAGDIHILIQDDGKGFDMNQPFSSDRVHMGLSMVENRLKRMCGAELKISSEPDKGTICEIIIPIEF